MSHGLHVIHTSYKSSNQNRTLAWIQPRLLHVQLKCVREGLLWVVVALESIKNISRLVHTFVTIFFVNIFCWGRTIRQELVFNQIQACLSCPRINNKIQEKYLCVGSNKLYNFGEWIKSHMRFMLKYTKSWKKIVWKLKSIRNWKNSIGDE